MRRTSVIRYDVPINGTYMSSTAVMERLDDGRVVEWAAFAGQRTVPMEEEVAREIFPTISGEYVRESAPLGTHVLSKERWSWRRIPISFQ